MSWSRQPTQRRPGSTASLSSDKSISAADLGKMTNFAHYGHYEIRITMRREHSAALKYMAAEQRLEPTLLAQYNGLGTLKQRKQVSRESIYSNILPI